MLFCAPAQVALLFPQAFWGKADMFGRIPIDSASRGEFFLFYSYSAVSGTPLLSALVAGEAAGAFEERSVAENVRRVMAVLRGWFGRQGVSVPEPLQVSSLGGNNNNNSKEVHRLWTGHGWDGTASACRVAGGCRSADRLLPSTAVASGRCTHGLGKQCRCKPSGLVWGCSNCIDSSSLQAYVLTLLSDPCLPCCLVP